MNALRLEIGTMSKINYNLKRKKRKRFIVESKKINKAKLHNEISKVKFVIMLAPLIPRGKAFDSFWLHLEFGILRKENREKKCMKIKFKEK